MAVSATERVQVVRPGETYVGRQGLAYGRSASAETVAYLLDGECVVYYGDVVERHAIVHAGDQIFIPADVPHAPCNQSGAPCTWLVVHSSGSDQDGIVLLPDLDPYVGTRH